MGTFSTSESEIYFEPRLVPSPEAKSKTERMPHLRETQVRGTICNLARVIKDKSTKWAPHPLVVFNLYQCQVRSPEAVVGKASQRGLTADIGSAERLLQVERDDISVARVRNGKSIIR
jgi:hypothetical protein